MTRTFVPTTVEREMPRGTVDWNRYRWPGTSNRAVDFVPVLVFRIKQRSRISRGTAMDCFPSRGRGISEPAAGYLVARRLMERIEDLLRALGPGPARRPGLGGLVAP